MKIIGFAGMAVALFAMLSATSPASARQSNEQRNEIISRARPAEEGIPTVYVHYNDLDLRNDSGVARLNGRVRFAVRQVCVPYDSAVLQFAMQSRACQRDSWARAKADIAYVVQQIRSGMTTASAEHDNAIRIASR